MKYEIKIKLRPIEVELPDDLSEDEIDKALEQAMQDVYLDEFTFRFNRRRSRSRGLLFYRLMQLAVSTRHTDYETIVWSCRGQMTKLRGRERRVRLPR